MEPFHLQDRFFFHLHEWESQFPSLVAGFTTKQGGVSQGDFDSLNMGFHVGDLKEHVLQNRSVLSRKLHMPLSTWVGAKQTHEITIKHIGKNDSGQGSINYDDAFERIDGFFTYEKEVLLTLVFADCVPIYFVAPSFHAIGIVHAGWKGTVFGIAEKMVDFFRKEQIPLSDIHVAIGPSICGNCYHVDDSVIDYVKNLVEDVEEKPYNQIKADQYKLDLKQLNKLLIQKAGIQEEQITVSKLCSSCDNEYFYSHRRDQGSTGRMMGYMAWKEDSKV